MAKKVKENISPWTFNGEVFTEEMVGNYAGFVYAITFIPTGQVYIGKKFFKQKRKLKGAKRRTTSASDWVHYWSSSDIVKTMIKEHGKECFKREIISLHELLRDVNYCEVRTQWHMNVLEEIDENGVRKFLNENIQGKYFPGLYIGWESRSQIAKNSV